MARPVAWTKGFPPDITAAQRELILAFEGLLVGAAAKAAKEIGALVVSDAGRHGAKMEERFLQDGPKTHRFYRASVGSAVERIIYKYLGNFFTSGQPIVQTGDWAGVYRGRMGTATDIVDFVFAIEYTGPHTPNLPCQFKRSRPDIRLALGPDGKGVNKEALFDLTSEGQVGHILKKGDGWLTKANVAYVSEIVWVNNDIMQQ
jgi:hypothetical protein